MNFLYNSNYCYSKHFLHFLGKAITMAFTYSVVAPESAAVGDQVRAAVAIDGHCYAYAVPTTGGATFQTISKIVKADAPPGGSTNDVLFTFYLTSSNPFSLPVDFTLKGGSNDFLVKATGTA